jgi:hypothetical protein
MESDKGEKDVKEICSFDVLFNEMPKILGGIDGCQEASNEARNIIIDFGGATVKALESMAKMPVLLNHTVKEIEE